MSEWISVKDRLPDMLDPVIYVLAYKKICPCGAEEDYGPYVGIGDIDFYGEWYFYDDLKRRIHPYTWRVTHWIPLSELPKENIE